jgi:hypothetical protein
MARNNPWRAKVEQHLGVLASFGFEHAESANSFWEESATWFQSGAAALKVAKNVEFQGVEVHFIRLVDGVIPPYPVWITNAALNWASLDNLLRVRAPELLESRPEAGLSNRLVAAQLDFADMALQRVAGDFLSGSTACIDEVAVMLRAVVAKSPQVITISFPDTMSDTEVEAEVAKTRRVTPPEVGIVVQRYARPH